ncbi:MAG: hypothetical protein KAQ98_11865 [Bacteriovoracaceae bacterium]|nr:hypothetical protein [Bacteriovoracaceae bacterium]
MKTQNGIKITVLPPRLEEEEVCIQPKEKETICILGDLFDEGQLDGFRIFENGCDSEGIGYYED